MCHFICLRGISEQVCSEVIWR